MILHCDYEELRALQSAAEAVLADAHRGVRAAGVGAEGVARTEELLPRLQGDVSVETLEEQRTLRTAVSTLVDHLHDRLDRTIIEFHPAHEEAVNLYFDYAHSRTVLHRLDEMGAEMEAIINVIGGNAAAGMVFPD